MKKALLAVLLSIGCRARSHAPVHPVEQAQARDDLESLVRFWLTPARIAPPVLASDSATESTDEVVVEAKIVLPEDADWNRWSRGGVRLFNNRVGYLFELSIRSKSSHPLQWSPAGTRLAVNTPANLLAASPSPEPLLATLQQLALQQEHWVLSGDLVERTRQARPFREAYLPTTPAPTLTGLVAFPHVDPAAANQHVVAFQLDIRVLTEGGPQQISCIFN